jgi:catechol 2,3-dioxygenase-like lactoylglutathione lyase family enzyme
MAEYLHTMLRITGPEKSRAFYEALGFDLRASRGHAPAGSFRWSA